MSGKDIVAMLRQLADSMEKENPDFELRDRLIGVLIEWSVDNGHASGGIVRQIGELLRKV